MSISKTYKYNKHLDDIGDIEKITLQLIATEGDKKVKLTCSRVLSEEDSETLSSMSDSELATYAQNALKDIYSDEDIQSALEGPPTLESKE